MTTRAIGEEDTSAFRPTTLAVGEEDEGGILPTRPTTLAVGEEDGGIRPIATTRALGEEDEGIRPIGTTTQSPTTREEQSKAKSPRWFWYTKIVNPKEGNSNDE